MNSSRIFQRIFVSITHYLYHSTERENNLEESGKYLSELKPAEKPENILLGIRLLQLQIILQGLISLIEVF